MPMVNQFSWRLMRATFFTINTTVGDDVMGNVCMYVCMYVCTHLFITVNIAVTH